MNAHAPLLQTTRLAPCLTLAGSRARKAAPASGVRSSNLVRNTRPPAPTAREEIASARPAEIGRKKIFVVDDHPILREGLRTSLSQDPNLMICGEAENAAEALETLAQMKPDLILVDIGLPGKNGLELIKDLRTLHPELPILVLSMHDEHVYAERTLRAGAKGYVMKHEPPRKLLEAIHVILGGDIYVSEALTNHVLHRLAGLDSSKNTSPLQQLTDREFEVYELIGQGNTTRQIADQLHLSCKTIQSHREHIKTKLNLKQGASLVRSAVRWIESLKFG